jgi:predicted small lipoprotein YifL
VLNSKKASTLALAVLIALAGCSKKEPAPEAAKVAEAPAPAMTGKMPEDHPPPAADKADVDLSGIAKADGGKTVEEVYKEKDTLANGKVVVRGKVVKVNPSIMGKNWLHVRDGSGGDGTNDLTVTTAGTLPDVGEVVVVTGTVVLDQDFGAGYAYDVIVEDAEIKVEAAGS